MPESGLDSVRQRFERDARGFDAIYRLERSAWSRWFNKTFRKAVFERYDLTFAEAGDVTGKKILDIGCGSGVYSVDFARRGAASVTGIDFAENMLALARAEAQEHGVSDRCQFLHANFLEADLPGGYDVAIAIGVFDYLPDPVTFLRKMARVTSGRIIASFPGHSLIRERARKLRYSLSGRGTVYFYSRQDVEKLVQDAGIQSYQIIPIRSSGTGFILSART